MSVTALEAKAQDQIGFFMKHQHYQEHEATHRTTTSLGKLIPPCLSPALYSTLRSRFASRLNGSHGSVRGRRMTTNCSSK